MLSIFAVYSMINGIRKLTVLKPELELILVLTFNHSPVHYRPNWDGLFLWIGLDPMHGNKRRWGGGFSGRWEMNFVNSTAVAVSLA